MRYRVQTEMERYVRQYAWWGVALVLSGCTAQAVSQQTPAPSPEVVVTSDTAPAARRFKIALTVTAPGDLKVREGDVVVPGQILADRSRDRSRLEFQRRQLQAQIKRLQQAQMQAVPEVAGLPPASFAEPLAAVESQRRKVEQVQRSKENQQRKLDVVSGLPPNEVPPAVVPHETEQLAQRQRELEQAQAELEVARAKLAKAQSDRAFQEHEYSLELSKRAIALRQQETELAGQLANLEAKLSEVEVQLSQLAAVRSPYGGKVQRIKWEGQRDQALAVELVLLVGDGGGGEE